MPKARSKYAGAWSRFTRDRSMYFVYDHRNPRTLPLLGSGKYGVVQLICITRTAQQAFKAGFNAGRRSRAGKSDGK